MGFLFYVVRELGLLRVYVPAVIHGPLTPGGVVASVASALCTRDVIGAFDAVGRQYHHQIIILRTCGRVTPRKASPAAVAAPSAAKVGRATEAVPVRVTVSAVAGEGPQMAGRKEFQSGRMHRFLLLEEE